MADLGIPTKGELMAEVGAAWALLHTSLARLSEAEMTTLHDSQGWTVKDHLTHIAAWEASVVSFLQGRPRHEGLGVDPSLYSNASFDDINAVIQTQRKDLSLEEATAQLQANHRRLLDLLEPLTDADLAQPLSHFLPGSPADDRRRAFDIVRDNTSAHFSEHLAWIEALVRP
jgi:hypothetical protein